MFLERLQTSYSLGGSFAAFAMASDRTFMFTMVVLWWLFSHSQCLLWIFNFSSDNSSAWSSYGLSGTIVYILRKRNRLQLSTVLWCTSSRLQITQSCLAVVSDFILPSSLVWNLGWLGRLHQQLLHKNCYKVLWRSTTTQQHQSFIHMMNADANLICSARKYDHVTSLLHDLYWLRVGSRLNSNSPYLYIGAYMEQLLHT